MTTKASLHGGTDHQFSDDHFKQFAHRVQDTFLCATSNSEPLFRTSITAEALWHTYLRALPSALRQEHICNECRRFIANYGNLVVIKPDGRVVSALWGEDTNLHPTYAAVSRKLQEAVLAQPVNSHAKIGDAKMGNRTTNGWEHFGFQTPTNVRWRDPLLAAHEKEAKLNESVAVVSRSLQEYSEALVRRAFSIINTDRLFRGETIVRPLTWFSELQQTLHKTRSPMQRNALIFRAVAYFGNEGCHIRSGVAGSLLDDLKAGLSDDQAARNFAIKLDPTRYRRPQVAPGEQNIKRGEEIVEKLGLAPALQRRFARLNELQLVWQPKTAHRGSGVFSQLLTEPQAKGAVAHGPTMTFVKFREKVLPSAQKIEVMIPSGKARYAAMVTAVDPNAPPIIQWDHPEQRNPVSWYLYNGGSAAHAWGLRVGTWTKVTGVCFGPHMWHDPCRYKQHGVNVMFVLDGCYDVSNRAGLSLFPEILRAELHEVRKTIEAYSKQNKLQGQDRASACGITLASPDGLNAQPLRVKVTTAQGVTEYIIDRFD